MAPIGGPLWRLFGGDPVLARPSRIRRDWTARNPHTQTRTSSVPIAHQALALLLQHTPSARRIGYKRRCFLAASLVCQSPRPRRDAPTRPFVAAAGRLDQTPLNASPDLSRNARCGLSRSLSNPRDMPPTMDDVDSRLPLGRQSPIAASSMSAATELAGDAASSSSQTEVVEESPRGSSSPKQSQQSDALGASGSGSALSIPLTVTNSQESHVTSSSAHAVTPPASDISSVTDNGIAGYLGQHSAPATDKTDHLLQLSTLAAARDRISIGTAAGVSRKRMADGEVKAGMANVSPIKGRSHGHARNLSAVSVTSTSSTIGEVRGIIPNASEHMGGKLTAILAVCRAQDSPFLRHGQGQFWLARPLYRGS